MARFCDDCPKKGLCDGEIFSPEIYSAAYAQNGSVPISENGELTAPSVMTVRFFDENHMPSRRITVVGLSFKENSDHFESFLDRVNICEGPNTSRFLGIIPVSNCAALE